MTFLPQLVQALKYEAYHTSALAESLITRSFEDARYALTSVVETAGLTRLQAVSEIVLAAKA